MKLLASVTRDVAEPRKRLDDYTVRQIRSLHKNGTPPGDIRGIITPAVSLVTIHRILTGKTYRGVSSGYTPDDALRSLCMDVEGRSIMLKSGNEILVPELLYDVELVFNKQGQYAGYTVGN
jgi:hypothetical protein